MTLAHDVIGTGPTVVLLHSSACDRRMWDPQLDALVDAGYRVLRCDFRGFGDSPSARSYSDAEDVRDLLEEVRIKETVLVGSSFGGRIAQEIAVRWPGRVTALVLLCPGMQGRSPSPDLVAFAESEDALLAEQDIDAATELNVDTWLGPDADERAREAVRLMQRHSFEVQLAFGEDVERRSAPVEVASISVPTLVVSGAHDLEHFRSIAADLAKQIPQARHVHLPWAGHLPSLERPAEINTLILDFLAAGGRPGPHQATSARSHA